MVRRKDRDVGVDRVELWSANYLEWYRTTVPAAYTVPPHVEWICRRVAQGVVDGELARVVVTMPPQHAKSDTLTRRLPVFWGLRFPGDNVLLTGYSQSFANRQLSQPARSLAEEQHLLDAASTALDHWRFTTGGSVTTRGVGNAPTGVPRLKLVIIDDPIKNREEAESEIIREKIWDWWKTDIVQRFWPDTRVVIICTRWHEDDLVGRLKAEGGSAWTFFNLPAIAIAEDVLGRQEGEALWPLEKPISFLEAQRLEMGPYRFEALFQGNPTPREGAFFHPDKIRLVHAAPAGLPNCLAWDMAAGEDEGDWTAGVQMFGPDAEGFYFVDPVRFRHEPAQRNRRIRQEAELRRPRKIRGPQDPGAAGKEAAQTFIRLHAGFLVSTEPVSGDKQLRAEPVAAQINAGNFCLLEGPFARDFLEELRAFPRGVHDDWVDALSDAFSELARPPESMQPASLPPGNVEAHDYRPMELLGSYEAAL